jgi:hemerythrin
MAFVTWKPEYSVGNSIIDAQHKSLIEMINKLHEALKVGKGGSGAIEIVREMIDYSKFHFDAEEKLMSQIHFPEIAEHKKEHQAFIAKTLDFENRIKAGTLSISIDMALFLRDWLSNHILVNDKAYSAYIPKA